MKTITKITNDLTDYFYDKSINDHHLYALTVTYNTPNNSNSQLRFINKNFNNMYIWILKNSICQRNFHKPEHHDKHPIVFTYPDVTGKSRNRINHSNQNLTFLSSVHHHSIMAVPDSINDKFKNIIDLESSEQNQGGNLQYSLKYKNRFVRSTRIRPISRSRHLPLSDKDEINHQYNIKRWICYSSEFYYNSRSTLIQDSVIYLPKSLKE